MKRSLIAGTVFVVLWSLSLNAQIPAPGTETDPILGVWKLSLEKSTYEPGPKPASFTAVRQYDYRQTDGSIVTTTVSVNDEGIPTFNQIIHKYDGKDYPLPTNATQMSGAKPGTQSFRIINPFTVERITKDANGTVTATTTRTVNGNNTTMTEATKGRNAQGQATNNVLVFERVK